MPAHTQTRRGVDKHADRQMSPDNTALGFRAPWVLLPPGTRFTLLNGVHCSPDSESGEELSCPQSRCLPARSLASVLHRLERPIRSPFIESFLLCQIPSCFSAGPRIDTGLSCPAWARVLYLSFPSVLEVFSFPGQGIPDEPPNVMPDVRIPEREERRLPRQCNMKKKGSLLLPQVRAPAATNTVVQGQRALSPRCYPNL